jgi:hypothetical protein
MYYYIEQILEEPCQVAEAKANQHTENRRLLLASIRARREGWRAVFASSRNGPRTHLAAAGGREVKLSVR